MQVMRRYCKVILVPQFNWGKNYLLGMFVTARIFHNEDRSHAQT